MQSPYAPKIELGLINIFKKHHAAQEREWNSKTEKDRGKGRNTEGKRGRRGIETESEYDN